MDLDSIKHLKEIIQQHMKKLERAIPGAMEMPDGDRELQRINDELTRTDKTLAQLEKLLHSIEINTPQWSDPTIT